MKKTLVVASMLAMLPCAAHAKSMITDNGLEGVTGQAGVSIDMDVRFDVNADTMAWGQADGNGTTSWIGMKNFTVNNLTVKLRPDLLNAVVNDQLALNQLVASGTATTDQLTAASSALTAAEQAVKPLTIDVATVPSGSTDGNKTAGTTYVRIGLGSLEIAAKNIDFGVALGSTATGSGAPTSSTLSQELGSVHVGNLVVDLNGNSTVDIYAANQKSGNQSAGSGVVFDLNVLIDKMSASTIAWGNTGGSVTGTSGAYGAQAAYSTGYVGLANMNITDLKITGPVSIQVATVGTSSTDVATAAANMGIAYATYGKTSPQFAAAVSAYYYSLYNTVGTGKAMGSSFVHIGLGSGNSLSGTTLVADASSSNKTGYSAANGALLFGMGSFTADVNVGSGSDLTTGASYGTIGINKLNVGMSGWVNIGTH